MFLIDTLHEFLKSSFVAQLISVIKNYNIFQKNSVFPEIFYLHSFFTIDFCIRKKSITSLNKKSLQKSLYTQQNKFSSLTTNSNLPIFTTNETITKLMKIELL